VCGPAAWSPSRCTTTRAQGKAEREALAQAIRERIAEFCEVVVHELVLADAGTIPKTSSGKRQRSMCRELYIAGQLKPARLTRFGLGIVLARSKAGLLLARMRRGKGG